MATPQLVGLNLHGVGTLGTEFGPQDGGQKSIVAQWESYKDEHPVEYAIWKVLQLASTGVSAYHGYKRNDSLGWGIWWGLMGGMFPIITPAFALAQGFGKRK